MADELKKKKHQLQKQHLRDLGLKLLQHPPPASKDALVKLLKQAASCLSELDQSPSPSMLEFMRPCLNAIAKPELLKHQDRDVKLLVATCICEILRITAPEAPYSDDILRDIFRLVVSTFSRLGDSKSPSFGRRVAILETLARYRSCVVMLDLECDDLVHEMFSTFFAVASDDHPESVLTAMQTIMILIIEESEDIHDNLLLVILSVLGRARTDVSMVARRLAMNVIGHCAGKLESEMKQFLLSLMSGDNNSLNTHLDYHEVIYDTYRCAPQIISGVIPYLTGELLSDQLNTRLKAVKLLGDLFALPDPISEAFQPIFSEFLKRLSDRAVEVRLSVVEHIKNSLLSNPLRVEASHVIASLCDRLLDYDENVRKQVVDTLCDVACGNPKSIAIETLKLVAERLRDKSLLVKRYTMERIAEVYRIYCSKYSDGSVSSSEFEWIPGKILRCFYDKDFRSETIEVVLCCSMFPTECTTKDRVRHWVSVFTGLDKVEVKALEKILEQKQRLQQEMQKYLSFRQMHQDAEASELKKKILVCFRIMSRWFVDPAKAEENFQILDQLKDVNVWKILTTLLDPNTSLHEAQTFRDDLLKILGERHPLYAFLGILSMKCSYLIFDKECVKEILLEVSTQKSTGESQFVVSCMNLLVILARFSPTLLSGTEGDLINYLKGDDEILKEGALHILSRAGGAIRDELVMTSSSVDLLLERLCIEGSRKQAKYAVHALAAITEDDGLKSLSVLYKRLVDMLVENTHLPSILQSLGCIAQIAMPIYETRESEVVGFITSNILKCSNEVEGISKTRRNEANELCSLKIFGLKTLVKSYLPVKDAHLRLGIENILTIIKNILSIGEVAAHVVSSPVDKAHMKLVSAKSVLRLSRYWDHKIPIDVFHLTLRAPEVMYPAARKDFLGKVHQYIRDRLLDVKYACAVLYTANVDLQEFKEYKSYFVEVIQMCFQAKARGHPMQCDANPLMTYPEYILPYLVHSFAHHSSCPNIHECKDVAAFETIYRQMHLFLSLLNDAAEDGKPEVNNSKDESISSVISIFQSINRSDDKVDMTKSKNSHAICDLGLSIIKGLSQKHEDLIGTVPLVPLPLTLYKPHEKKEGDDIVASTWLARESVLAYFQSLKLESNGVVGQGKKMLYDSDRDENELPLGLMMKNLKAQGSKSNKNEKKKVLPAETKKQEKDFDILGMVREINLDGLERLKNPESDYGDGCILSEEVDDQKNMERGLLSRQRKRQKTGELTYLPSPKQKRSSSTQDIHKSSRSPGHLDGATKASHQPSHQTEIASYQFNERDEEIHVYSKDKISMEEDLKPVKVDVLASRLGNKSFSSERKDKVHNVTGLTHIIGEAGDSARKVPNVEKRSGKDNSNLKSSSESIKKRKRRSIAGLAKCSLKEGENHSLVGCRIKVWWPLDKQFYEGLVQSYDPGMEKHEILYDDGELEVLNLDKERWELITKCRTPKKQLKSSKSFPTKGVSTEHKKDNMTPGSLQQKHISSKKSSSSKVRWKGTQRKSVEHKQSNDLENNEDTSSSDFESRGIFDFSNSEPGMVSKVVDTYSCDSERKRMEISELADSEYKKEENSDSGRKQNTSVKLNHKKSVEIKRYEEKMQGDTEEPYEEKSNSEGHRVNETEENVSSEESGKGREGQANEKSTDDNKYLDKERSDSPSSGDSEYSDDEPLSVWKSKAGNGRSLKLLK